MLGPEKIAAFLEAWQAMAMQGVQVQQKFLQQAMGQWWKLWMGAVGAGGGSRRHTPFRATVVPVSTAHVRPMAHAAARIAAAGISPVHRRVTDNVRRLAPPKKDH
jgi:hypothetical protein